MGRTHTLRFAANGRLALIAVLWLACGVALWRLDVESIWHDEAWSIRAIDSPLGTPDDNTPPAYYIFQHGLQTLGVGDSVFALRYGSVLIHLLTVAVAYRLGERWFRAGLLAGLLIGLSPLLWEYAQEIRAYAVVPLLALLLLWGVDWLMRQPRNPSAWIFVLVVESVALYTHNLAVPLVAWLNVILVGAWFMRWSLLGRWMVAQGLLFALYLPWLLTQSPSGTTNNTVPEWSLALLGDIWQAYFFPVAVDQLPDFLSALIVVAGIMALVGAVVSIRKAPIIAAQALTLPILTTILLIVASIDFHPRYYVASVPATLLLIVVAVQTIPARTVATIAAVGVMLLITQQSLHTIAEDPIYQHDDFEALVDYYSELPAEAVILIPYPDEPTLTHVFRERIQAEIITLPLDATVADVMDVLNVFPPHTQVELLTWFQLPADEGGLYPCLLGAHSPVEPVRFTTYGLASARYRLNTPIAFETHTVDWQVNAPITLDGDLRLTSSSHRICIISDWSGDGDDDDYKVAARLNNPFDWEIASSDSLIVDGQGYSLLEAPLGAPGGAYDVSLRLYSAVKPDGYDWVVDGVWRGLDVRVPQIVLAAHPQLPEQLALVNDNVADNTLATGQALEVAIQNPVAGTLVLQGSDWQTEIEAGLVWQSLPIPDDVADEVTLVVDEVALATYAVTRVDRIYESPSAEVVISDAQWDNWAALVGVTVSQSSDRVEVELVWQAMDSPSEDYVVTVQLLDDAGTRLVGSDHMPINRPTSGWVPDEYIVDSHTLNIHALEYTGKGKLIVALYNPTSGERLRLPDGAEALTLPIEIGL